MCSSNLWASITSLHSTFPGVNAVWLTMWAGVSFSHTSERCGGLHIIIINGSRGVSLNLSHCLPLSPSFFTIHVARRLTAFLLLWRVPLLIVHSLRPCFLWPHSDFRIFCQHVCIPTSPLRTQPAICSPTLGAREFIQEAQA